MKILKVLRFVFTFGNFILLFRTVSFSNRKFQIFMYCTASADIILTVVNGIVVGYYNLFHHFTDMIYIYTAFSVSMFYVISSLYYSKRFHLLLKFLDANSNYLMQDVLYLKDIKRKIKTFKVGLTIYITIKVVFMLLSSRYSQLQKYDISVIVSIILQTHASLVDIRFSYEYCVFYSLLYLISEQLETIIRYIVKEKQFIALIYKPEGSNLTPDIITNKHISDITRWSLTYTYLAEATDIFNKVFGVQVK